MKAGQIDLFEAALIGGFTLVLGLSLGPWLAGGRTGRAGPHLVEQTTEESLRSRFGPDKNSQGPEEWVVRDFFGDKRSGTFVDVGAYEAISWSNTYYLERHLGWTGVAIDALEEFRDGYKKHRPLTRFVAAFVTDRDSGAESIFVDRRVKAVASGSREFLGIFTTAPPEERQVSARTIDSILDEHQIKTVDFVSLDIELGEPAALRGFSLHRFRPSLVVIEAHESTRQQILNHMAESEYVVVGRYLGADRVNLYFSPLQSQ